MQTDRRALVLVPLLLLLASVIAACLPDDPAANLVGAGPLLTVETRGGECVDGPCGTTVVIERDGHGPLGSQAAHDLGTIPADELAVLDVGDQVDRLRDPEEATASPVSARPP